MSEHTLALPEELTIYTVGELRTQWLGWLADLREDAVVDGSATTMVDAAGVQLLASLCRALDAREIAWRLQGVGGALREACRTLGLAAPLGLDTTPTPAA